MVFGGKRLFEKLCKNHLTGKLREKLKKQWRELRQGTLISIGSKSYKGNRLIRFENINGQLHLRITTGNREFIYAKVLREPSNNKDKWLTFMAMLLESWQTKNYFAYTVELKLRDGEVYGNVSFEIPTPEVKYTRKNGVIAIDTNASPIHLAIAKVSKTGELLSYKTISLHHLLGLSQKSEDHQSEKQGYSYREPKETYKRNAWRWESYTKKNTSPVERQKVFAKTYKSCNVKGGGGNKRAKLL